MRGGRAKRVTSAPNVRLAAILAALLALFAGQIAGAAHELSDLADFDDHEAEICLLCQSVDRLGDAALEYDGPAIKPPSRWSHGCSTWSPSAGRLLASAFRERPRAPPLD